MKYDDASWHSGGEFPEGSPPEYGGTHIGMLLKWCLLKGWAGELHLQDSNEDLKAVINGAMTGTEFLFRNCDGKFTDEDLNDEGNAFVGTYYGENGPYLADFAEEFGGQMYIASENEHDFQKFSRMVDRRYDKQSSQRKKPWWKG